MVHPNEGKWISTSSGKTDKVDAKKLAELARGDLLPRKVHLVEGEARRLRELISARTQLNAKAGEHGEYASRLPETGRCPLKREVLCPGGLEGQVGEDEAEPDPEAHLKSVSPEHPAGAATSVSLLMAFYTVRSERLFCEQLDYNLLFRWFLDMGIEPTSASLLLLALAFLGGLLRGVEVVEDRLRLRPRCLISIRKNLVQDVVVGILGRFTSDH